ncbi:sulfotransferase domain-containing protein [Flavobacterium sp.]|uniref:sulfotransferase domain-containing protein n=1 Tax=Flavobacterium sp. TaxID=239 RepID=UPI0038FC4803
MKRIAIHSVPRSGSTWLGEIFNSNPDVIYKYQPLFSYAFKDRLTTKSSVKEIIEFYKEIGESNDDFLNQIEARKKGKMTFFKKKDYIKSIVYKEVRYHHIIENLLINDSEIKVIGLVRNPLAVINSWLNAPKEFKKDLGWDLQEEWRYASKKNQNKPEEFNGYEKWKEVTKLFLDLKQRYPNQFCMVNYDDLLQNTEKEVVNLFEFCGLVINAQTKSFLTESKKINHSDAYSIFKSKRTDNIWRESLPKFIIDEIFNDSDFIELNKLFSWV